MTGDHVFRMNTRALDFIAGRLEQVGVGGEVLELDNFYLWVRNFMTTATTEALFGENNPFLEDPSLLADIWYDTRTCTNCYKLRILCLQDH